MHSVNRSKVYQKHKRTHYVLIQRVICFVFIIFSLLSFSDVNYAVKEITEGAEYEFRVLAINESGSGDPSPPSATVCAKNPNSK